MKFLSVEPLLEDLGAIDFTGLDWVIVGGESGPGARPMPAEWVRPIRDDCVAKGIPFFCKQWGGVRKHTTGRVLDGRTSPDRRVSGRTVLHACANRGRWIENDRFYMKTLCIVPCGKAKIWDKRPDAGPTPAKDVYTGPFATMCRRYALRFHSADWCIISAKYGFLQPDDRVPGRYEVTFNRKSTQPISVEDMVEQAKKTGLLSYDRVVCVAGSAYVDRCRRVFGESIVVETLSGCRSQGAMMQKLKQAILAGVPLIG